MKKMFMATLLSIISLGVNAAETNDQSWEIERKTRTPENDQLLFTVENKTPKEISVRLAAKIYDAKAAHIKSSTFKTTVQPNSSLTVKKSECEFLAWLLNAHARGNLPLNYKLVSYINFCDDKCEKEDFYYNYMTSMHGYGDKEGNEEIDPIFPFGGKFILKPPYSTSNIVLEKPDALEDNTMQVKASAPENDQILFTVQNTLSEAMPVSLSMTIWDQNFSPFKQVNIAPFKTTVQPNSSRTIKRSECELIAWLLNAAANDNDLPLNCDFLALVGFKMNSHPDDKTAPYTKGEALHFNKFSIGQTFSVREDRYIAHTGKEVVSFKVES